MSAEEKQEFLFVWKIKHFDRIHSPTFSWIGSAFFEVEFLKDIMWDLTLKKESQKLVCRIHREECTEIPEPIPIDYEYKLTTSAGITLNTSDTLSYTFDNDDYSYPYELLELDDRNTPEDVCLRCLLVVPRIIPSMKSSPCSVEGWLVESDIVEILYPFELSLDFSESNSWTSVANVTVEYIPIDITFKYVNDELQIKLFPIVQDKAFHNVWCTMDLKDEKSETVVSKKDYYELSNKIGVLEFPSFIRKRLLERANCFVLKKLTMKVVFEYKNNYSGYKVSNGDSATVKDTALTQNKDEANCFMHLHQHLRNMLNEKTYSDLKLTADGEVFFAHKCLLASRSPVFKAMFDQDMLESKTNNIDIHDVDAKILKYFLEYLYTGTVDDMDDEIALSLLVVADRYQVSPLTEKCSTFLKSALNTDNVLDVLVVADMVNQDLLKVFAIEYLVENSTQVLSLPDWPEWMKMNSTIASEIFLKLAKKLKSLSKSN